MYRAVCANFILRWQLFCLPRSYSFFLCGLNFAAGGTDAIQRHCDITFRCLDNSGYAWQPLLIRQYRNPAFVGFASKDLTVRRRIFRRTGPHWNISSPAVFPHNHGFVFSGSGHRFDNAFAGFRHAGNVPRIVILGNYTASWSASRQNHAADAHCSDKHVFFISLLSFFWSRPSQIIDITRPGRLIILFAWPTSCWIRNKTSRTLYHCKGSGHWPQWNSKMFSLNKCTPNRESGQDLPWFCLRLYTKKDRAGRSFLACH